MRYNKKIMDISWHIRNAIVIDPASGRERKGDVWLAGNRIVAPPDSKQVKTWRDFDAAGRIVTAGFIDLHVHLREPGYEEAETIATGSQAALAGGFTTLVAMPNTKPPIDRPDRVKNFMARAIEVGQPHVFCTGCLSLDRAGREPSDLAALAHAGVVAFTDDGSTIPEEALMTVIAAQAAKLDKPILDHALDHDRAGKGAMHEGRWSKHWGIPGIPSDAESLVVARDIRVAAATGCRMHIQHLSAGESLELIRHAQARHLKVSAEATPHHLSLTDEDVRPDDANGKMNPPLRTEKDRQSLIAGVLDGSIEALATDHAPHTVQSKAVPFAQAPFGIVGLETAIGATYTELVIKHRMSIVEWIRRWTTGPAKILGLLPPSMEPGSPADIVVLDVESAWTVDPNRFISRSRNTPFAGKTLTGRPVGVFYQGELIVP